MAGVMRRVWPVAKAPELAALRRVVAAVAGVGEDSYQQPQYAPPPPQHYQPQQHQPQPYQQPHQPQQPQYRQPQQARSLRSSSPRRARRRSSGPRANPAAAVPTRYGFPASAASRAAWS